MRLAVATLALATLFCTAAIAADAPRIQPDELVKRIEKQDASIVVVDVRSAEEFAAGHVPGAINLPHTHMPARLSTLAAHANKDIVLYCESGVRTQQAVARMQENGFKRLFHLEGDMAKWREAKRPIDKSAATGSP